VVREAHPTDGSITPSQTVLSRFQKHRAGRSNF
jgi:hypothetical protein